MSSVRPGPPRPYIYMKNKCLCGMPKDSNRIKNNASLEELEKIVDYVRKNIKRIYEQ